MADLRVNFAGVEFRNPILISSSSLTNHPVKLKRLEEAGAGGVITKLASTSVPPQSDRQAYRSVCFGNNTWGVASGDRRLTLAEGVELVKAAKKELRIPVVANVIGKSYSVASWIENASALQDAGADMLEMDLNCQIYHEEKDGEPVFTGEGFCMHPEMTMVVVRALKETMKIPVIAKLSPVFRDLTQMGMAVKHGGGDGISAINASGGFGGVDIRDGGKPLMDGMELEDGTPTQGFIALLGAETNHSAARQCVLLATNVGLPLSSGSGVMDWETAVERMMLGATTVQMCSAVYLNGPRAISQCVAGMNQFLDEYGYGSPSETIGLGLKYFAGKRKIVYHPLKAVVEDATWSGWPEVVEKVQGDCLALTMREGIPEIDRDECTGCGLCYWFTPRGTVKIEVLR